MKKKLLLTATERTELIARHKVERDKRVCDRIKAVLLYDDGYSYTTIAKILLLDDETIRRHIQEYEVMKKLKPANGDSDSLLSVEHSELLLSHLQEQTYRYVKDICAYVKAMFCVDYTVSGIRIVYEQSAKVNEDSIQSFLYRLRKKHPGHYKIHVIWDNAGYHRSKTVRCFVKTLGIVIHYLPPYLPNLNPIERLWKILHEQVTRNRYYETFADFKHAVQYFLQHIGKKKTLLRQRINDNFQVLTPANFAS